MMCAQCGAACPEGAERCEACGAALSVAAGGEAGEPAEVVVLETTDEAQLMAARALLEAEGIECVAPGEDGRRLIGAGPMRLVVESGQAEAARALLTTLVPAEDPGA